MLKSSALIILLAVSVGNCQFFYNYEENGADEPQRATQDNEQSMYQYNTPSAVNQQFIEPSRSNAETSGQERQGRTRIRVRSRNYQTEPAPQPEYVPDTQPEIDQHAARQERRQERRRQRLRDRSNIEPTLPPRIYSQSIFQNIGLGEVPSGIYVPHDSLLNVLKNPSRTASSYVHQPPAIVPQNNNYVQPAVSYVNNEPQHRFFGQPPLNEDARQTSMILPISRPQNAYSRQTREHYEGNSQNVQARAVGTSRQERQRTAQSQYAAPPTVDIDSYRQVTDDIVREDIQVMPQVEYAPVAAPQDTRSQRRKKVTHFQKNTSAPRVYGPSIFQNVGLGEAPSGVYVPEDSLLNALRNPSAGRSTSSRASRTEFQQLPAQSTYNQASVQNDYLPEVIEEEQYQPPPPPPPPTRRRSSQRLRSVNTSNRSENRGHQNQYEDQVAAQPVQSSQRRTQRRNDNYDDTPRHQPPARQPQMQPQRRQQTARAPVPEPQESSSDRGQSTRKAKLAIAELPLDTDDDGIPGEAGVNYPTLHVIPKTTFSCSQQSYKGYYADLETSCQVVHLCQSRGVKSSFLCPNGTIFSQEKFSCQWWYEVNCSDSPRFYIKNDELYKVPEKQERKRN